MSDPVTPDHRPAWLRALLWVGIAIFAAIGLPLTVIGLLGLRDTTGRVTLCLGLVCLVSAAGGIGREVAERRHRRHPPQPRLVELGGEAALFLPRAGAPARIASLTLCGYALVLLLGALFTLNAGSIGWTVILAVLAGCLLYAAAPWRSLAGGVWFTPQRMVHEHDGRRWEAPWEVITGAVPQQPMPVLVRPDRMPTIQRTGPRGRAWNPVRGDRMLAVDTRHLAGGATLAAYIITKALGDPASRALLGTPASLPPT